jgi:hypothetical protein
MPTLQQTRRLSIALALAAGVLAASASVRAHHSQSEFNLKARVEVEGTVTKLEWKSPHGRLYVDVKNAKGEVVSWNFELPSPNTLMRRGWTRDTLKTGDRVTVAGAPARNFPTIAVATSVKDAKGTPLFTGTTQSYEPESDADSKAAP